MTKYRICVTMQFQKIKWNMFFFFKINVVTWIYNMNFQYKFKRISWYALYQLKFARPNKIWWELTPSKQKSRFYVEYFRNTFEKTNLQNYKWKFQIIQIFFFKGNLQKVARFSQDFKNVKNIFFVINYLLSEVFSKRYF